MVLCSGTVRTSSTVWSAEQLSNSTAAAERGGPGGWVKFAAAAAAAAAVSSLCAVRGALALLC